VTLSGYSTRLARAMAGLAALSPLDSLSRGYSLCFKRDGTLVRRTEQVAVGEELRVIVSDGSIDCRAERMAKVVTGGD